MRVLVPLDGSEFGELALAVASPLCRAGGEAVLAAVLDEHRVRGTSAAGGSVAAWPGVLPASSTLPGDVVARAAEDRGQAMERATRETNGYLDGVAARLLAGIPHRSVVEWAEQPSDGILALARREAVDLIVIGTHGRSGLRRALLGSVAEAVVRESPVPVRLARIGMTVPGSREH